VKGWGKGVLHNQPYCNPEIGCLVVNESRSSPLRHLITKSSKSFAEMRRPSTAGGRTLEGDAEKGYTEHFAAGSHTGEIVVSAAVLEEWNAMSKEEQVKFDKKLLLKLDFRLIPWLSLLYLLSFLDRTNIGNAKIQGVRLLLTFRNALVGHRLEYDESTIQHVSDDFLHQLLPLRSPVEYASERLEAAYLASIDDGCMGHLHDVHGLREQLPGATCCALVSWLGRSWIV